MAARPVEQPTEQSVGQLVMAIKDDLSDIVRGEIELAKAELRESTSRVAMGAVLLGVAAFLLVLITVLLSIAAAYGLTALGLHPGWAFLIVAGVYLITVAVLGLVARSRFRGVSGPQRTRRSAEQVSQALRPRT